MRPRRVFLPAILFLTSVCLPQSALRAAPDGFDQALATLLAVGPEAKGNAEASAAWKVVASADSESLVPLLEAMGEANPLALNWIRSALETIVDRDLAAGKSPSIATLGGFLFEVTQNPRARRFAFELIQRSAPNAAEKLIPGLLNDPAVELRRDAVAWLTKQAADAKTAGDEAAAGLLYEQAIRAARDVDQIKELNATLTKMGRTVDLPRHFGFLMEWKVLAPFDNTGRAGFDTVYPRRRESSSRPSIPARMARSAGRIWSPPTRCGMVDFNKLFPDLIKEVTGYAYTEFDSAEARPAELRLGCKNAWKIWVNGKLIFGRDEYHRGARIDQYRMPIDLQKGKHHPRQTLPERAERNLDGGVAVPTARLRQHRHGHSRPEPSADPFPGRCRQTVILPLFRPTSPPQFGHAFPIPRSPAPPRPRFPRLRRLAQFPWPPWNRHCRGRRHRPRGADRGNPRLVIRSPGPGPFLSHRGRGPRVSDLQQRPSRIGCTSSVLPRPMAKNSGTGNTGPPDGP
ncbi:MAG: hypothetical protein R3F31_06915 [Verrucomicrobiales bacterium]